MAQRMYTVFLNFRIAQYTLEGPVQVVMGRKVSFCVGQQKLTALIEPHKFLCCPQGILVQWQGPFPASRLWRHFHKAVFFPIAVGLALLHIGHIGVDPHQASFQINIPMGAQSKGFAHADARVQDQDESIAQPICRLAIRVGAEGLGTRT